MIITANVKFKQILKKALIKNSYELKWGYYNYLLSIIDHRSSWYDKEALYSLKSLCDAEISFEKFYGVCQNSFSNRFLDMASKHIRRFNKAVTFILDRKNEIEYLLSYYDDNEKFFDGFNYLDHYFNISNLNDSEKTAVIFYYLNCNFNFFKNENINLNEKHSRMSVAAYLKTSKYQNTRTGKSLKTYLLRELSYQSVTQIKRKFYEFEKLIRSQTLTPLNEDVFASTLYHLNLNFSHTQVKLLFYNRHFIPENFNIPKISEYEFKEQKKSDKQFYLAKERYLSQPEIELLDEAKTILDISNIYNISYYELLMKYNQIKKELIKLINETDEEALKLNDEVMLLLENIQELTFMVSSYIESKNLLVLNRNSN